jgi:hypothetical protein
MALVCFKAFLLFGLGLVPFGGKLEARLAGNRFARADCNARLGEIKAPWPAQVHFRKPEAAFRDHALISGA